jgi:Na+:H+ antiporter, NhaA family
LQTTENSTVLLRFINHEATGGLCLVLAAAAALVLTNAGFAEEYRHFLELPLSVSIGSLSLSHHLIHWINDGLMAIFFFLVGLEIKREVLEGNLSSRDQITLPAMAALGGMIAPALIYTYFNYGLITINGWAIPAATDIAFALGALALLGKRIPISLKVFLLALATLDDLGAIIIIAIFYTADLSFQGLALAGVAVLGLLALNFFRVGRSAPYILLGILMWLFVIQSGVHATLAGVVLAMTVPLTRKDGTNLIHDLEEGLHHYVKFLILPLFAFANAGLPLGDVSFSSLTSPLSLGISTGLTFGKPLGIMFAVFFVIKTGLTKLPDGTNWIHMFGVSCLAGIGFTMSLFIGSLAFEDASLIDGVRLGVITGSMLSAVLGLGILLFAVPRHSKMKLRRNPFGF